MNLTREEKWACLRALEKAITDTPPVSLPNRAVESARQKLYHELGLFFCDECNGSGRCQDCMGAIYPCGECRDECCRSCGGRGRESLEFYCEEVAT